MKQKAEVVDLITKDKLKLNGLWFGPKNPNRVLIFIHGLGGTTFGHHDWLTPLVDKRSAVLFFNNRGNSTVSRIKKLDKRKKKGYTSIKAGEVFEIFTDCVKDVQAAVDLAKSHGGKNIYLVGHSTGCQKSVYFLSKSGNQKLVQGGVLLCPVSDYSGMLKFKKKSEIEKVAKYAKKMVAQKKANDLIPLQVWPHMHSAQRFLNLYTPDSIEEIFSYINPDQTSKILQKVKIPTLVVFAGADEYADRPAEEIVEWFRKNSKSRDLTIKIIKNALHSFQGKEKEVTNSVSTWLSDH